jgi:polyphosphate kinase
MSRDLYVNRELSWLEFNRRVLEEAQDPSVPLLERVKFLAIFSSNLDEFFMVRVAGLKRRALAGDAADGPDDLTHTRRSPRCRHGSTSSWRSSTVLPR